MCRLAAHVGAPAPLSTLLYDQPRSLQVLAYEPREQQSGRVNVDGTGVVWFPPPGGHPGAVDPTDRSPLQYRSQSTPWADDNLPGLARRVTSHVVLAAVRSATPGIPFGVPFVHPFAAGDMAGTHNGFISDFRGRVARPLTALLSDEAFASLPGLSDAAVLFLLAHDARTAGANLEEAAREATDQTMKVVLEQGATATLTLVLADDGGVAAVNAATGRPANSLYVRWTGSGGLLASEPLDDGPDWEPVAEGAAVSLTAPQQTAPPQTAPPQAPPPQAPPQQTAPDGQEQS